MSKNCIDCQALRAKIPLKRIDVKTKYRNFSELVLDYNKAAVSCSSGMLVDNKLKNKVFKNIFKLKNEQKKSFNAAEKCPCFVSMDD